MSKKSKRLKQRKNRLIDARLVEQWISQAHHQMYQGDFARAITTCEPLLNILPKRTTQRVEVLALLGLAYGMLQRFPQSYDAFTEALTLDPTNADNISRIRTPFGNQPPRYRFFLNPYPNTRFTTCPRCGYKTRTRKFSLFIHIDPDQPLLLDKICRFCYHCNLIIAHQDQLEDQMATTFSTITPEIIGNTYEVLGTIDRSEWKGGMQDQLSVEELLEHLHDFNEVVTYKRVGV